jgi:hypothetical protein
MTSVRVLADGAKSAVFEVVVSDVSDIGWTTVVDLAKIKSPAVKRVRIDEIFYALSDKVEVQIAWHHPNGERHLLMPLGGRGRFAWPEVQPSAPGDEHTGNIEIRTIGLKAGLMAYLMFDLVKQ